MFRRTTPTVKEQPVIQMEEPRKVAPGATGTDGAASVTPATPVETATTELAGHGHGNEQSRSPSLFQRRPTNSNLAAENETNNHTYENRAFQY